MHESYKKWSILKAVVRTNLFPWSWALLKSGKQDTTRTVDLVVWICTALAFLAIKVGAVLEPGIRLVRPRKKPRSRTPAEEARLLEWNKITSTEEWKRTHIFIECEPYQTEKHSHIWP